MGCRVVAAEAATGMEALKIEGVVVLNPTSGWCWPSAGWCGPSAGSLQREHACAPVGEKSRREG